MKRGEVHIKIGSPQGKEMVFKLISGSRVSLENIMRISVHSKYFCNLPPHL